MIVEFDSLCIMERDLMPWKIYVSQMILLFAVVNQIFHIIQIIGHKFCNNDSMQISKIMTQHYSHGIVTAHILNEINKKIVHMLCAL